MENNFSLTGEEQRDAAFTFTMDLQEKKPWNERECVNQINKWIENGHAFGLKFFKSGVDGHVYIAVKASQVADEPTVEFSIETFETLETQMQTWNRTKRIRPIEEQENQKVFDDPVEVQKTILGQISEQMLRFCPERIQNVEITTVEQNGMVKVMLGSKKKTRVFNRGWMLLRFPINDPEVQEMLLRYFNYKIEPQQTEAEEKEDDNIFTLTDEELNQLLL